MGLNSKEVPEMMGYGYGWGWGMWVFMAVVMVLFWLAIAAVVVVFVRHSQSGHIAPPQPTGSNPGQAMQVLDERFARGDIDADEYTRRRDLLRGQ
jgi:putative membrane protein